jgi:hypothetical protein
MGLATFGQDFYLMLTRATNESAESESKHCPKQIVLRVLEHTHAVGMNPPLQRQHSAILHDGNLAAIENAIEASTNANAQVRKVTMLKHVLASQGDGRATLWSSSGGEFGHTATTLIVLDCESADKLALEDMWDAYHKEIDIIFVINVALQGIYTSVSDHLQLFVEKDVGLVPALRIVEASPNPGQESNETAAQLIGALLTQGTNTVQQTLSLNDSVVITYDASRPSAMLVDEWRDQVGHVPFGIPVPDPCTGDGAENSDIRGQFLDGTHQRDMNGDELQFDRFYVLCCDVTQSLDVEQGGASKILVAGQVVMAQQKPDARLLENALRLCAQQKLTASMKTWPQLNLNLGDMCFDLVAVSETRLELSQEDNEHTHSYTYPVVPIESVPPGLLQTLTTNGILPQNQDAQLKFVTHGDGGHNSISNRAHADEFTELAFACMATGLDAPNNIGLYVHSQRPTNGSAAPTSVCVLAVVQQFLRRVRMYAIGEVMTLMTNSYIAYDTMKDSFPNLFCLRLNQDLLTALASLATAVKDKANSSRKNKERLRNASIKLTYMAKKLAAMRDSLASRVSA